MADELNQASADDLAAEEDELEDGDRDVEKGYSTKNFVAKLRRLANALEQGKPFSIQVAGEKLVVPADAQISVEHERTGATEELEFQLRWPRQ